MRLNATLDKEIKIGSKRPDRDNGSADIVKLSLIWNSASFKTNLYGEEIIERKLKW